MPTHRFAHHLGSARSPQRTRVRGRLIADLLAGCQDPQHVFARKSFRDARGVRQLGSGSRRRRVQLVRRRPRCQRRCVRWSWWSDLSREVACSGRSCICWAGIGFPPPPTRAAPPRPRRVPLRRGRRASPRSQPRLGLGCRTDEAGAVVGRAAPYPLRVNVDQSGESDGSEDRLCERLLRQGDQR